MKRYNILCFVLLIGITLCGCQAHPAETSKTKQQLDQTEYESDDDFELSLHSSIGKEQCFICGTPAGGLLEYYRKFDSIGIIHWADMSVTDTRIREYDDDGNEKINSGHMNKNSNGKSSYRGLGSIDFQAAARSVLIVGRIKDEPEVRVVCHTKSSLAPEGKAIAFRLEKDNGFEWIGEYDISADELLNGDGKGQKSRKAKEFLLERLADGGLPQKKIEEEAEKQGIKKKTLRNAKMELEIDSVKHGNQWYWILSK